MVPYKPEDARGWIVGGTFDGSLDSWRVGRTLKKMRSNPQAEGHSDKGVQNLLFMLTVSLRPRRVLEIGTHIGMGAVIIGHALKTNRYGKLLTLEPAPHYQEISAKHIRAARVTDYVQMVPHFSYDETCKQLLREEAPFELIFIDGAHDYAAAAHDIAQCGELLCQNGLMVVHDVGTMAESFDTTGNGGVRRALADFCATNAEFRPIFLEFPIWLNPTGTALVVRQDPDPLITAGRGPALVSQRLANAVG